MCESSNIPKALNLSKPGFGFRVPAEGATPFLTTYIFIDATNCLLHLTTHLQKAFEKICNVCGGQPYIHQFSS
jgi:hypothetical protein